MASVTHEPSTSVPEPLPYLKTFALFALSMILNRLIRQTDLTFLSYFDPSYLNIFAYLNRMNWLENVVMFALVPLIIKIIYQHRQPLVLSQLFHAILILSGLTTLGAAIVYSIAILGTGLQHDSMLYLYGAAYQVGYIPLLLTMTFFHMTLFSLGYGDFVLKLTAFKSLLNVVLDALFMHHLELGFHGVFLATYGVYFFTLTMFWFKLKQHQFNLQPRSTIKASFQFLFSQANLVGYESIRLFASLFLVHLLFYLAYANLSATELAQFSAAHEFLFLTNLISVALLRVTTMYLESDPDTSNGLNLVRKYRVPCFKWFGLGLCLSGLFFVLHDSIAKVLYNLQTTGEIWHTFFMVFILYYPLNLITSIVLAAFHVHSQVKKITQIDVFCRWVVQLPFATWSLLNHEPWLLWLAMLMSELMMIALGTLAWRKQQANTGNELISPSTDT